ncbi:MAG: hypothetical protein HY043_08560 [Verrucomicrobia bacterium]|nr:hypothetical protein [Verrucomicrobiota bacterium]
MSDWFWCACGAAWRQATILKEPGNRWPVNNNVTGPNKKKVILMNERNCDASEKRNVPKSNKQRGSSDRRFPITPKFVETIFTLEFPKAREVYLCGDFNGWSPVGLEMIRRKENGHWEKRLALVPGRYEYKFVVDGEWLHDNKAFKNVPNASGSLNSVVEVRA